MLDLTACDARTPRGPAAESTVELVLD